MSDAVIAPVLSCRGLAKTYASGPLNVTVLSGVDIDVQPGERIAIVGKSGSGKSTLLHLLGGLDSPSAGSVTWLGRDIVALSESERGRLRNRMLGFSAEVFDPKVEADPGQAILARKIYESFAQQKDRVFPMTASIEVTIRSNALFTTSLGIGSSALKMRSQKTSHQQLNLFKDILEELEDIALTAPRRRISSRLFSSRKIA